MTNPQDNRTYTLAQAAEELHLSPEIITEVLTNLGVSADGEISEADINRVMEHLEGDDEK